MDKYKTLDMHDSSVTIKRKTSLILTVNSLCAILVNYSYYKQLC